MRKFVMNGGQSLVLFFEGSLRGFAPGEIIEADQAPHSWFKEVIPTKAVINQPVVTKRKPKINKPRIDFKE